MTKNQLHFHILTYFCKKIVDSNHHALLLDFYIEKNRLTFFEIGLNQLSYYLYTIKRQIYALP